MFSLSANWLRDMPFAFLVHFTVHLSILDMSTHIIVLTVIEHIICSLSIAIIRKSVYNVIPKDAKKPVDGRRKGGVING